LSGEPKDPGSYREAPREPRYLCIVCFAWSAPGPGTCGQCGAPLHDISNPEVLQTMHEEANRRLKTQQKRETLFFVVLWGATWVALEFLTSIGQNPAIIVGAIVAVVASTIYTRTRSGGSAMATLAARAVRKKDAERPEDKVPMLLKPGHLLPYIDTLPKEPDEGDRKLARFAGPDPDLLDGPGLVKWFGARLHD
jgi:hypothetical protein